MGHCDLDEDCCQHDCDDDCQFAELEENKKNDPNANCTRPEGCYSQDGKCLCNLGCDCNCHNV
jgi:hypothetical protein